MKPLKALIFDSYYDEYRGVILYVRIFSGTLKKGDEIKMMATNSNGLALEIGKLQPQMTPYNEMSAGEIGYIVTNLKTTREAKVGDTVTLQKAPASKPLPGYKNVQPFVYAGFFPVSNEDYQDLKDAIEKLSLSDSHFNLSQKIHRFWALACGLASLAYFIWILSVSAWSVSTTLI